MITLSSCVSDETATATMPAAISVRSSYPDPAAVKAERDASTKVYVACLARAVKRLDDRKSDPGTIAHAAISACSSEFESNVDVYSKYLEDGVQGREKVATSLREGSYGSTIQLVLEHRNGHLK